MKVTLSWLKSYVDFTHTPEELVHKLTMIGLEVDSLVHQERNLSGIIVGHVASKEPVLGSDHLSLCQVDVGGRNLSIVCGAPNVESGQKVPVAVEGTRLPAGQEIRSVEIHGIQSQGMICSEAELGISSRADAIMVLSAGARIGESLDSILGKGETVIDIDVTPNRPDCFGVIGIAREIAAFSRADLHKPTVRCSEGDKSIDDLIKIQIEDPDKCPRYTARFIGNVSIQPSPWWLTEKLEAVGIRSINNVVDVTNYVMMETGQPLHAFDYDLLRGAKIIVKTATDGEEFKTLDEKRHTLNAESLMICDGEGSVAIGGIMGGLNSEVSNQTKNVLLECAYFDPVNIRRTAKFLGISTESAKRFERGTDPNGLAFALDRAAQLIAELSGGEMAKGVADVYPKKIQPCTIKLRPQRVNQLLGTEISENEITDHLSRLEFQVRRNHDMEVVVPTFRPDVTREADLIEEIARHHSYDAIPADTRAFIEQLEPQNVNEPFLKLVKQVLISSGFSEVVTYAMIRQKQATWFLQESSLIALNNPLSEDYTHLRPSLVPGLLNTLRWNINRKISNLKIFEIGNVFSSKGGSVLENTNIAGAITGMDNEENWASKPREVTLYNIKGYVESLLRRSYNTEWKLVPRDNQLTDHEALDVFLQKNKIGFLGGLKPELLERFDIEQPVYIFELDFYALAASADWRRVYQPIPRFPAMVRDIAVVVHHAIDSEKIIAEVRGHGGPHLQDVQIFDVYTGDQVEGDQKSVALKLTFYSLERTLTEEEVESQINIILNELQNKYSARLRG